jgi:hypothetical protein
VTGYCPGCSVLPVKIADASASTYWSLMAKGITYATDNGADVISMSYSGTTSSTALADAVGYANGKGIVMVGSAGNDSSTTPRYPAAYSQVISVAATDAADGLASYSNRGASWVELAAPGCNYSTRISTGTSSFGSYCGTSSAAPAVAGIVGLALSAAPGAGAASVQSALNATAVPVGDVAYGRVDAAAALEALGATLPALGDAVAVADPSITATNGLAPPGALDAGVVVGATPGRWSGGAPALTHQWMRCDTTGAACSALTGATGRTYTTTTSDLGSTLRVHVSTGTTGATSAPVAMKPGATTTPPPPAPAPSASAPPVVSGAPQEGSVLSTTSGSWSGSPTSYSYRWRRCDSQGATCADIPGATGQTYTLVAGDVGATIRSAVTAANASGSATSESQTTAVIAAKPAPLTSSTWTGSISAKVSSQSFAAGMGGGSVNATLTFSKISQLTVSLVDSAGATVATATGPSGVKLGTTVPAGSYRFVVRGAYSGKGSASFTLAATYTAP